ncbi:MAG: PaaI family thioesterase [Phycisphaerae bacterium]
MSAITDPSTETLRRTRQAQHPRCVVCGRCGPASLGLEFTVAPDGSVSATFRCPRRFEGYNGMLHGGVISAIADGAMTNCLFARGIRAVTAELTVRFRHPIVLESPLEVTARVARESSPLFLVEATLVQEGERRATATGKFMQTPKRHTA